MKHVQHGPQFGLTIRGGGGGGEPLPWIRHWPEWRTFVRALGVWHGTPKGLVKMIMMTTIICTLLLRTLNVQNPTCPLNKCTRIYTTEFVNQPNLFHYPFRAFHNWVVQNISPLLKVKIRNWKENVDIYNNYDRDSRVFELIIALNSLPLDQFLRLKNISEVAIIKIKAAPSLSSFPSRNLLL